MKSVKEHEGYRSRAYKDSVGVWTIGYGTNLQTLEIDEALASKWLEERLEAADRFARTLPEWLVMDDPRRAVIVEMIYNLGPAGYVLFANTRRAMQERDWERAAHGMLASKWAKQVGRRAARLAEQMRTGIYWNKVG